MDKLRAAYRVAVIIGLVMMASLVVYALLVGLFENETITLPEPALTGSALEVLRFALLAVAAAVFIVIRIVNGKIIGRGDDPSIPRPPLRNDATDLTDFSRLTTAAVITYALSEVPAILGLVLYIVGRNSNDFYLLLIISFFFFGSHFPKFSQWEEWYRKQLEQR